MSRLSKKILDTFYRPVVQWYISTDRDYSYKGLQLHIPKGVFHPGLFFSTKQLVKYIDSQNIQNKTLLELGCGSGLISVYSARAGARVTATDINPAAVKCAAGNAALNKQNITTVVSDLFDDVPPSTFDFIIVNPPYFKRKPKSAADYAWFCGEELEYFQKLATQLGAFLHVNSKTAMILSEDCDVEGISAIFSKHNFNLLLVSQSTIAFEKNFIFEINHTT